MFCCRVFAVCIIAAVVQAGELAQSALGAEKEKTDKHASNERASDNGPSSEKQSGKEKGGEVTGSESRITFELGKQVERSFVVSVASPDDEAGSNDRRQITVPFLFFVPESYGDVTQPFPLMLFLHGYGESGDADFDRIKIHGPPKIVDTQKDFDFIVVSPQVRRPKPGGIGDAWKPDVLIELLDLISASVSVDSERTYVTGLSMGGFGTWRLIAAYPDRFAAAVPICGGGDIDQAKQTAKTPVWAFHGGADRVVPLVRSEEIVKAVEAAGGDAKLTVYPETGHDSWTETYDNEQVYRWLLSKRKRP